MMSSQGKDQDANSEKYMRKNCSILAKNGKPYSRPVHDSITKFKYQKQKDYKTSPVNKYRNYTESSFNIHGHKNQTYDVASRLRNAHRSRPKRVKQAKKQLKKQPKQQIQTFDNRDNQQKLIVDDKRSLYLNLFEQWKRSKYPNSKLDSSNKDSFYMQNANCK